MASTASFKQQCPSCEAMVPIRDPALVGRKIDCPKCKYRFVVERPEDEDEDDDDSSDTPAPTKNVKKSNGAVQAGKPAKAKPKPALRRRDEDEDEEDDRPQKKKSGASMTLILGGVLGLLAVGLLAVGAMFALGVFGESTKPNGSSNSSSGGGNGSNSGPIAATDPTPGDEVKKEAPNAPVKIFDISNLLPNDSEAVVNYQIDKLSGSGFRDAALGTAGAYNENAFKTTFGFPLHDANAKDGVQRVVTALNNSKHWVFTVVRTMKPINRENLIASLGLEVLPPVNGLAVYTVKGDLDSLSNLLIKANRPHDDFQVCLYDGQTLVFADPAPMEKFLADGGMPKELSQPTTSTGPPANNSAPPGMMPGGSMTPGSSSTPGGSMTPGSSSTPGGSMTPGSSSTPGGSMTPGSSSTMPGGSMTPGSSSTMPGGAPASAPAPAVAGSYLTISPAMKGMFDRIERSDQPTLFSIVVAAKDPMVPTFLRYGVDHAMSEAKAKGLPTDNPVLAPMLDKQKEIKLQDFGVAMIGVNVSAFNQEKFGGAVALQWNSDKMAQVRAGAFQFPIGMVNRFLSDDNPLGPLPPGGLLNPMGGFTPPPGGSGLPGGSMQPGGSSTFGPGGNPGNPNGNPADMARGPLAMDVDKSVMTLSAAMPFKNDWFQDAEQDLGQFMIHLKGDSDLLSNRSRIHDLAGALSQYVKANGQFPRGTANRRTNGEQFADWAPDQRISWMADLLPFLGDGDGDYRGLHLDPQKSWKEGDNLIVAGVLIPQFLSRGNTAPPLIQYPKAPSEVATTNYVGVAGVGLDAAEYAPGNPNAGVFGYNRETKPADVKRGLDQTIALLQMPATEATPWLAGGGATIRGISEGPDAVKQFVCAEYQGKRGTFAVMADGKVRFIPETIDLKIFRTLCLIAGEKVADLDKITPVVAGEAQPVLRTAPAVAAAPTPDAPAPPAGKTDQAAGWSAYTPNEGGFTIQLPPYKFQDASLPLKTAVGNLTVHTHMGALPNNGGVFIVSNTEFPAAVAANKIDAALDGARTGALTNMPGAKLTSESKISLDGNPGREFSADTGANGRLKVRAYIVKNRLYQLMVGGTIEKVPDADAQKFFDSFKLTAK